MTPCPLPGAEGGPAGGALLGKGQMGSALMGSLQILCFWQRDFLGTPVNLLVFSPKVTGRTFFPNLPKSITFAAAPLVLTSFLCNKLVGFPDRSPPVSTCGALQPPILVCFVFPNAQTPAENPSVPCNPIRFSPYQNHTERGRCRVQNRSASLSTPQCRAALSRAGLRRLCGSLNLQPDRRNALLWLTWLSSLGACLLVLRVQTGSNTRNTNIYSERVPTGGDAGAAAWIMCSHIVLVLNINIR